MMRFYKKQHPFYCGIDLRGKTIYVCIFNEAGEIRLHRDIKTRPDAFLRVTEPVRKPSTASADAMKKHCQEWKPERPPLGLDRSGTARLRLRRLSPPLWLKGNRRSGTLAHSSQLMAHSS
jgi:hypothetical protein